MSDPCDPPWSGIDFVARKPRPTVASAGRDAGFNGRAFAAMQERTQRYSAVPVYRQPATTTHTLATPDTFKFFSSAKNSLKKQVGKRSGRGGAAVRSSASVMLQNARPWEVAASVASAASRRGGGAASARRAAAPASPNRGRADREAARESAGQESRNGGERSAAWFSAIAPVQQERQNLRGEPTLDENAPCTA